MHTEHAHGSHEEKKPNYIPMIVIVVILAFLAWLLLNSFHNKGYMWKEENTTEAPHGSEHAAAGHEEKKEEASTVSLMDPARLGSLDSTTQNFIYNIGDTQEIALPDGVKLKIGSNSSEAKLITFLNSAAEHVDTVDKTKGWISLDRLYFQTGKSTLTPTSETQLKNIAAILKAYPNVTLKLGGYTDNSGTAEGNLKLSDSRAKSAMASLVGLGTPATALAAEGYGQEHPIADNGTQAGMALNRRIDIRVTKK